MDIDRKQQSVIIGAALIIIGGLALLSDLGIFGGDLIGVLLFAGGGAYLLSHQGSLPPLTLGRARAKPTDEAEAEPAEEPGGGEAKETA